MSDNEEHDLHELVRNALNQVQPSYEEPHWTAMQEKLRKNPRNPIFYWLLALLIVGISGVVGWSIYRNSISKKSQTASTPVATKFPESEPLTTPISPQPEAKNRIKQKTQPTSSKVYSPLKSFETDKVSHDETARTTYQFVSEIVPFRSLKPLSASLVTINLNAIHEREIKRRLNEKIIGPDSVTSQALERNKNNWRNAAIVCDFTSSMYPHATELFTWLSQNRRNRYVKGAVFFTDCDSLGHETKPGGLPGKMYLVRDWQNTDVLPIFIEASRNTVGNSQRAENDLESILYAQKAFPQVESFVLIADNSSPVKDMQLLAQVKKPVHIIVCGVTYEPKVAIQPDYLTIAAATKGSIHTLDQDIPDVTNIKQGTKIRMGTNSYKFRKGKFVLRNPNGFWKK